MERLGRFAEQTTPTFTDLGIAAPGIDKTFENAGPFSKSTEGFFKAFGKTAKSSGAALKQTEPLLSLVKSFGQSAKPFAGNLSGLLSSVRSTGGLERLLDLIYLGSGSVNGYDALGHFLRAEGVAGTCLTYAIEAGAGCKTGKFVSGSSATASTASANSTSVVMARTLAVLKGMTPAEAIAKYPGSIVGEAQGAAGTPSTTSSSTLGAQPVGGAAAGTTYYAPSEEGSEASGMLLNYLLGN
jgi:hypothetical protein